jgi:hypothetical protein
MDRRTHLFVAFIIIAIAVSGCIVLPPDNVSLKQKTISSVSVSWKAKLPVAGGFTIERKADGGDFEVIATLPMKSSTQWSYVDVGLETGIRYIYRIRSYYKEQFSKYSPESDITLSENISSGSFIIDHTCMDLSSIPDQWIKSAKSSLHVAYQHTSHGSQLVTGMYSLPGFKGSLYSYNEGGTGGALDLRDEAIAGGYDLGNPDRTAWASKTREYLNSHAQVNVIMWAWCGEVSTATVTDINTYLNLMSQLEADFPDVKFVYMTGHTDGTGLSGNLALRNKQIRDYCIANNKILYDFADIESYDPDGNYYGDKHVTGGCNYDYNNNGTTSQSSDEPPLPTGGDHNWALDWQKSHTEGIDWYYCGSAHSQPLNANQKAYAAWWLFARLAGWDGE